MNINSTQPSFGSVYFKRVFDHYDGMGVVYKFGASIEADNKGDVYFNYKKACESKAAKELSDQLHENGNLTQRQLYVGLLNVLNEVPKVNALKKHFSKDALAQLNKYKDTFYNIFLGRL